MNSVCHCRVLHSTNLQYWHVFRYLSLITCRWSKYLFALFLLFLDGNKATMTFSVNGGQSYGHDGNSFKMLWLCTGLSKFVEHWIWLFFLKLSGLWNPRSKISLQKGRHQRRKSSSFILSSFFIVSVWSSSFIISSFIIQNLPSEVIKDHIFGNYTALPWTVVILVFFFFLSLSI